MTRGGERELSAASRQLQSVIESGARAVGAEAGTSAYGVWLSRALGDRRLPRTVPAAVPVVAKLLRCYGREFGWRLGRPELARWADAFDADRDGFVAAEEVRAFCERTGGAWRGGPERAEGPWVVAFGTGDADADAFITKLRDALHRKDRRPIDLADAFLDAGPKAEPWRPWSTTKKKPLHPHQVAKTTWTPWSTKKQAPRPGPLSIQSAVKALARLCGRKDREEVAAAAGRAFRAGAFAAQRESQNPRSGELGETVPRGALVDTALVCRAVRRAWLAAGRVEYFPDE